MASEGLRRRALDWIVPGILVAAFVAQCLLTASRSSLANDEAKHLVTGWWLLAHGECCIGRDNSPLTAWFALPLLVSGEADPSSLELPRNAHEAGRILLFGLSDPESVLFVGRCMTIVAGVILLMAAFALANRMFGPPSGLITLGILAFSPNVIAQYSLMSTDALFVTTALLFLVALDQLLRRASGRAALLAGLCLGLALSSKLTALILVPSQLILLLLYRNQLRAHSVRFWAAHFGLLGLAAAGTVWVGYGANLTLTAPFVSFPGLTDGIHHLIGLGRKGLNTFFNGEVQRYWPGYFAACLALKTPLPELILWILGLAACASMRPSTDGKQAGLERWAPALMAAVFLALGLASRLNIGIRHILPLYAFMAVTSGALAHGSLPRLGLTRTRAVAAILLLWFAAESVRFVPFSLSYFNQLAGGPRGGVRYLGDSNLDWGQDLKTLKRVMQEHGIDEVILAYLGNTDPGFYGIPYQYLPLTWVGSPQEDRVVDPGREILAVSTNNLQGFLSDVDFGWLWSREPFATAGYSIYLYDITGDAEAHEKLASIYRATGYHGLARKETEKAERSRLAPWLSPGIRR